MSQAASDKVAVSFDCEGINLGVKGQLTLFQLGTASGLAYIFDLITCPTIVSAGGLQRLLESETVTKVSGYPEVTAHEKKCYWSLHFMLSDYFVPRCY
jgi:hypothetical protein